MNYDFDWYKISEERKVRLARIRLIRSARVYWTSVERDCVRNRVLMETWEEMKNKLKEILS